MDGKVSVVIPTRNRADLLARSLRSVCTGGYVAFLDDDDERIKRIATRAAQKGDVTEARRYGVEALRLPAQRSA